MQDVTFVFLAGVGNSGPEHWQRMWFDRVPKAVWVEHDNWDAPERGAWVSDLQKTVWQLRGPMIFVAHSLGCLLLAAWANERDDPSVAGAFLVAVPDPGGPLFPAGATGFDDPTAAALPFPAIVIASRDDPYAGIEYAHSLAVTWGASFIDAGPIGHINAASGLGAWEDGWRMLEDFVGGLTTSR